MNNNTTETWKGNTNKKKKSKNKKRRNKNKSTGSSDAPAQPDAATTSTTNTTPPIPSSSASPTPTPTAPSGAAMWRVKPTESMVATSSRPLSSPRVAYAYLVSRAIDLKAVFPMIAVNHPTSYDYRSLAELHTSGYAKLYTVQGASQVRPDGSPCTAARTTAKLLKILQSNSTIHDPAADARDPTAAAYLPLTTPTSNTTTASSSMLSVTSSQSGASTCTTSTTASTAPGQQQVQPLQPFSYGPTAKLFVPNNDNEKPEHNTNNSKLAKVFNALHEYIKIEFQDVSCDFGVPPFKVDVFLQTTPTKEEPASKEEIDETFNTGTNLDLWNLWKGATALKGMQINHALQVALICTNTLSAPNTATGLGVNASNARRLCQTLAFSLLLVGVVSGR
ncbi:hypothetical protein Pelo_5769 [Pelomyxa schiedti]|nr:hypothetical protein Pelo_5769 [Pelomyxa schiedti]